MPCLPNRPFSIRVILCIEILKEFYFKFKQALNRFKMSMR